MLRYILLIVYSMASLGEMLYEVWSGDVSSYYPPSLVPPNPDVDEESLPKLRKKLFLERLQVLPDYKLIFCLIGA